jgi:hypothetical protein
VFPEYRPGKAHELPLAVRYIQVHQARAWAKECSSIHHRSKAKAPPSQASGLGS